MVSYIYGAFQEQLNTMMKEITKHKIFFPNLDGWRFFCFLAVFFTHSFTNNKPAVKSETNVFIKNCILHLGDSGVSFFFVLSGFLITYLILSEIELKGKLNLLSFYIRRSLRIWPLYYAILLFGFFVFPFLKMKMGDSPSETADPWLSFTFLNNYNNIINGPPDASVIGFLWSVAIEEQFYLFWPLLFVFVPVKHYKYLIPAVIGVSFLFRALLYTRLPEIDIQTPAVIGDMAIGGYAAWMILNNPKFKISIQTLPVWLLYLMYAVLAASFFFKPYFYQFQVLFVVKRLFFSGLFILIILEQNYCTNSFFKMGNWKLVSRLGTYSYGFYLLHSIGILASISLLNKLALNKFYWQVLLLELPLSLALTIGMGWVSYTFYESWFIRLKGKFSFITR